MADNRREHLKTIAAVGVALAVPVRAQEMSAAHSHPGPHYHAPTVGPFEPKFFTAEEGLVVARLADLIIPPTDTPGAVAAGVPHYIDARAQQNPEQQKVLRDGIAWLEAHAQSAHSKRFIELAEEEQVALLLPLSQAVDASRLTEQSHDTGVALFRTIKGMTTDGYYTSYAGLVQELGYQGNQMLPTFEGCEHEH